MSWIHESLSKQGVNTMRNKEEWYDIIRKCDNYEEAIKKIYDWVFEDGFDSIMMADMVVYAYKVFIY